MKQSVGFYDIDEDQYFTNIDVGVKVKDNRDIRDILNDSTNNDWLNGNINSDPEDNPLSKYLSDGFDIKPAEFEDITNFEKEDKKVSMWKKILRLFCVCF